MSSATLWGQTTARPVRAINAGRAAIGGTKKSFGDRLRRLRSTAGLSQEELAERSGVSRNGISDLERGLSQTPRFETVRLLADGLGIDEDERAVLLAVARPARWRMVPRVARRPHSSRCQHH